MASPVPIETYEPQTTPRSHITNYFNKVDTVIVGNSVSDTNGTLKSGRKKCSVHEERSVDFLCVLCDKTICQLCKMSEHEGHETKSISLAAGEARGIWTSVTSNRIQQYEQTVWNTLEDTKMQMHDLTHAANAVEKEIRDRCTHLQYLTGVKSSESNTVLAKTFEERLFSAQKKMLWQKRKCVSFSKPNSEESMLIVQSRQEVLQEMILDQEEQRIAQLKAMKAEVWDELARCVQRLEEELQAIGQLKEKMEEAMEKKDHIHVVSLHQQLRAEFSAEQLRSRLRKVSLAYSYTIYHEAGDGVDENQFIGDIFWNDRKKVVQTFIQNSLGCAVKNLTPAREGVEGIAVQLKPAFYCSEQRNAFVKFICPRGEQRIMVSFCTPLLEEEPQTKMFDLSGKELEITPFGLGTMKTITKSQNDVSVRFLPYYVECEQVLNHISKPVSVFLFAKHNKCHYLRSWHENTKHHFRFYLIYLDGHDLKEVLVGQYSSSKDILNTTAFDASVSGDSLAVVNVIVRPTLNAHGLHDGIHFERELMILERKCDGTLKTYKYNPPTPKFFPADVCFLHLHGEEVLAVADMDNNAIHLCCTSSDNGNYVFQRFLVEDHELLKAPTALNTDAKGRLWVACNGGRLLMGEILNH